MRHAKSSWDFEVGDIDRSLTERGIKDAYKVAASFSEQRISLDWLFTSPATRALQTALIFSRTVQHPLDKITIADSLYDFSGEQIIQYLRGIDDQFQTVGVFGHNNAMTHVVSWLLASRISEIPTAGLTLIQADVDHWEDFITGELKLQLLPKEL